MELKITDILNSEEVQGATNYNPGQIWEKRPFLTGLMQHEESIDNRVNLQVYDTSFGEVVFNTGIDDPAVTLKPPAPITITSDLAHFYFDFPISMHDVNAIIRKYNAQLKGLTSVNSKDAYKSVQDWAMGMYENVVNKYVMACEFGACQAISMPNGFAVPNKTNQTKFDYKPAIAQSIVLNVAAFADKNPESVLMDAVAMPAMNAGHPPNIIVVGDDVKEAIMASSFWAKGNRPAPAPVAFKYKPALSKNEVFAKGALELAGMMVGSAKVFWSTSMVNKDKCFNPKAAVAFDTDTMGTIYSGVTTTMVDGADTSIVRHSIRVNPVKEKEMHQYAECFYLPVFTAPHQIFRAIFN